MLRQDAGPFVHLMQALGRFWATARLSESIKAVEQATLSEWEGVRETITLALNDAEEACNELALPVTLDKIRLLRTQLDEQPTPFRQIFGSVKEIGERFESELKARVLLFVPPERAKYFSDETLFGASVAGRLPKLAEDIAEAGKCFACGRYSATVFHLMRVMEAGLGRLAKLLRLTINLKRPWGHILRDIAGAIAALPGAPGGPPGTPQEQARHEKFAEVAAYLSHVKDAWRNTTMHPKRTYTEEEAEHLFSNVRAFMQALVKLR